MGSSVPARAGALLVALALIAAACSGRGIESGDVAVDTSVDPSTGAESSTSDAAEDVDDDEIDRSDPPSSGVEDETLALDDAPGAPSVDAFVPLDPPAEPVGRPGYTRYVYTRAGEEIIPALVEGPRGSQVRCQAVELPCSAGDLVTLAESGGPVPAELGLGGDELEALVEELAAVQAAIAAHPDPASACAAGYEPDQAQTPNMGSHFTNQSLIDAIFDPGRPEILLYAKAGGATPDGALGECVDGAWVGEEAEVVGAAFFVPWFFVGQQHFDGFSGSLDNWHIHYNLCRRAGQDTTIDPALCGPGTPDGPPDQPRGDASQGWMIHAWADTRFDNQLGVFSMWNPTLWPAIDPVDLLDRGPLSDTALGTNLIADFALPDITLSEPGRVQFFNADTEAHTVTAGTPTDPLDDFDSGIIAGRDISEITLTEPGEYSYFCVIHPTMQATITVEG